MQNIVFPKHSYVTLCTLLVRDSLLGERNKELGRGAFGNGEVVKEGDGDFFKKTRSPTLGGGLGKEKRVGGRG